MSSGFLNNVSGKSNGHYLVILVASTLLGTGQVLSTRTARLDYINNYNKAGDKPELVYDKAWFTVSSSVNFDLHVWAQTTECYKCALKEIETVHGPQTKTILIETRWPMKIKVARHLPSDLTEDICSFENRFRESGDYWLFLDYEDYVDGTDCGLILTNDPLPAEMPILFTILGLFGLAALWRILKCIYQCRMADSADISSSNQLTGTTNNSGERKENVEVENGLTGNKVAEPKKRTRLRSLDTFRGFSLSVMIFVNYGGGGYWFFDHPPWNGMSVADLVFPWFIFIMGTAMNFSFRSMYKRGKTRGQMFLKICKRSAILFSLGIMLATKLGPVDFTKLRIPGVLQRFAFTYFIIAMMELVFHRSKDSHADAKWAGIREVVLYIPMWILNLGIVGAYLSLTFALPVPNCPTGYIGPGGLSEGGAYFNCTGGAARYIDELVLGYDHLYHHPTPQEMYETEVPFDPEGILGILTSVFLCFLGLQAGRIIITYQNHTRRIVRFLIWGVILGAIAALLCKCSQQDGWIPLNKNLWSLSFVLLTASFAFFMLTVMYIVIDVLKWWEGGPFIYPGMNSIVVYCGHSMMYQYFPVTWKSDLVHWKLLLQDVWGVALWCLISFFMFRKNFFVAI